MKKFSLGLVAAAASVACGSSFASVDFRPGNPAAATAMASELSYASTANRITAAARLTISADLGFGVNNLQTRHIKVTLSSNATLAANPTAGDVTFTGCSGTTAAWVGGGISTSSVIYQITGGGDGCAASSDVQIVLPAVSVSNNQTVTAQYQLFDTAPEAVAGTSALASSGPGNFLTFVSGLATPTLSASTNTLAIGAAPTYTQWSGATNGPVEVGKVTIAPASAFARGAAVTLANLISASSSIAFSSSADFGSGSTLAVIDAATAGVTLCTGATALTLLTGNTQATFSLGAVPGASTTYRLCWTTSGAQSILPQTVTADFNPTNAADATVNDPSGGTIGTVTRDGTELVSPYVTINSSYNTAFTFRNTSSQVVTWRASVTPESGGTCAAGTTTGTVPANGIAVVNARTVCPTISGAANNNRAAFVFAIEAPSANINGSMTTSTVGGASTPNTMLLIKNGSY
jgi:hypothetical protein